MSYRSGVVPSAKLCGIVRYAVGTFLMLAAVLKAHHVLTDPFGMTLWHMAIAPVEWILGIWLCMGLHLYWSWSISTMLFVSFIAVLIVMIIGGVSSCNCFGVLNVPPHATLAVDIGVVFALAISRPHGNIMVPLSMPRLRQGVIGFGVLIAGTFTLVACTTVQPTRSAVATGTESDTTTVHLGYIAPGGTREAEFKLSNPRDTALRITRYAVECKCTTLLTAPEQVPSRSTVKIPFRFVAPEKTAHYRKRVIVTTDDPQQRKIELMVTAKIGLPLQASLEANNAGDDAHLFTLVIRNDSQSPIRILYVTTRSPDWSVRMPRQAEVPGQGQLRLPVYGKSRRTSHPARITLHTAAPNQRQLVVTLPRDSSNL